MFAAYSGEEEPQGQDARPEEHEHQYSEEEIHQVAIDLSKDGKKLWSENPRLYIILKDLDQIPGVNHFQLPSIFIANEINDTWLPILSRTLLVCLLPPLARPHFLRAQYRVCSQPSDFKLGSRSAHGHFHSENTSPFWRKRVIGSGRIGDVDEVWSFIDGKCYARKTIRRRLSHVRTARQHTQSFRRELQALRRIDHIHCVKIAGSYTDSRHLAIIMSPVANFNLREYLVQAESLSDPVTPIRLRKWFGCLATAVQYLHDIKIRHRDIKPENILVHGRQVLLVDFELCHDWKDLSQSTTTADCGRTILYAAPEVIRHMKSNSSSDIWSLGCVFLEIITILKGKRISQMRALFESQTENAIFSNNQLGISQWMELLENLSGVGNAPLSWISKMLQHDKDLRPKAGALIDLIRNSQSSSDPSNLYFCRTCRPGEETTLLPVAPCSVSTTKARSKRGGLPSGSSFIQSNRTYPGHIHRNPESASEALVMQRMRSSFHPYFMKRHLTTSSMEYLTRSIVAENGWDSFDVNGKVSFLPGYPIQLHVRRFIPKLQLFSLQKSLETGTLYTQNSSSVGIHEANPLKLAQSLNQYLNAIVDSHLAEQSELVLRLQQHNLSSQVLKILFEWFQTSKERLPDDEVHFLKSGIKVVIINKILGLSPILEEMAEPFENCNMHGVIGPKRLSAGNQSSRLLSRQLKVALFLLQNTMLEQALLGLRCLLKVPESWMTCLCISMCLSFVLETMIVDSSEYRELAKEIYEDETATKSDVDKFCDGIYGGVFQRIYRQLSLSMKTWKSSVKSSTATRQLLEALGEAQKEFELEPEQATVADVQTRYPSPLISALVCLVESA